MVDLFGERLECGIVDFQSYGDVDVAVFYVLECGGTAESGDFFFCLAHLLGGCVVVLQVAAFECVGLLAQCVGEFLLGLLLFAGCFLVGLFYFGQGLHFAAEVDEFLLGVFADGLVLRVGIGAVGVVGCLEEAFGCTLLGCLQVFLGDVAAVEFGLGFLECHGVLVLCGPHTFSGLFLR